MMNGQYLEANLEAHFVTWKAQNDDDSYPCSLSRSRSLYWKTTTTKMAMIDDVCLQARTR